MVREWQLEKEVAVCQQQIAMYERDLGKSEEDKTRQIRQIASGHGYAHAILKGVMAEIQNAERMISSFKERVAVLQTEIKTLREPTCEEKTARADRQGILAGLAAERLLKDEGAECALQYLRRILWERSTLTLRMKELAREIDLQVGNFDDDRFDAVLRSLPDDLLGESREWVSWFLAEQTDRHPGEVQGGEFLLPECLANNGAVRSGDCPVLSTEEWSKLDSISASRVPFTPADAERAARRPGAQVDEVVGTIQRGLLR